MTAASACAPGAGGKETSITVLAAASLTDAFQEAASAFEQAKPEVNVTFSFGGSQQLLVQLEQGARADIFAAADERTMDLARQKNLIEGDPRIFAGNSLVVVLPRANSAGIRSLQDLARPGLKIALANPDVPVGVYSRRFLELASRQSEFGADYGDRVLANVVSEETNVKQVLAKVLIDEVDAGIVYTSDVAGRTGASIQIIEIPAALNPRAEYPIAVVQGAGQPQAARAFLDFILSAEGQAILVRYGFTEVKDDGGRK